MELVQDLFFSGSIYENPLDCVRDYECLIQTPNEIEESSDTRKRESFPLSLSGKHGIGTIIYDVSSR
jgi:hypothetical protein